MTVCVCVRLGGLNVCMECIMTRVCVSLCEHSDKTYILHSNPCP